MIDINLVPPHLQRKKGRGLLGKGINIPREVIIGLVGGFFVILLLISILFQITIFAQYAQRKRLKQEWEAILPAKTRADTVINQLRTSQTKIKSVEDITGGKKIKWAQKLNTINDSLSRGVWLKSVVGNKQRLVIEGSAVSKGKDEMSNVHEFAASLKKNKGFGEYLSDLELGSIQRRAIKTVEVADFSMTANVQKAK
ncbi:MAG: hypothetical protein A2787_06630 [Omnitrophica WOR_2 bacterium RIFCSPHIGHO2_01_FULL_48_9]|nr:MAG: hypothetical protein A3D10_05485 [Omnitrophica WOR_2 bacterium RIFCSPHIGHO2_02_FULL_48_11]OGX30453.1 MAG: hypothetical protein A2787_06630 [Omnitrophica WOR_2 bacterium RIFCSPHIGHO2_01_FULL_48_9]